MRHMAHAPPLNMETSLCMVEKQLETLMTAKLLNDLASGKFNFKFVHCFSGTKSNILAKTNFIKMHKMH